MKKQIVLSLSLAVLAAPAFASKARLQALGEDIYGSQYINDNRNIFLNASALNGHKDMVTFEWGDTSANQDANGTPRSEGGVTVAAGNLVYGVHLGSESNTSNGFRALAMGANTVTESNNLDLFVAGDAGIKWGANLTYGDSESETADTKSNILRSRLGVDGGMWQAFANISLANKAEEGTADTEFKGNAGYQLGGSYNLGNDLTAIANYSSFSGENQDSEEISVKKYEVGVGRSSKLNDKANLFYKLTYLNQKTENDFTGAAVPEQTISRIPLVVGLEVDSASWLTLRGSIAQNIMGTTDDGDNKDTIANTTTVNAGATLKFGELSVDGVIGNGTAGAGSDTTDGQLNTDILMSYVSMSYKF